MNPAKPALRAVIYARLSSDPKKQGKSVADQITEGRRECQDRGWTVARVFSDNDRSASRHATRGRVEYERMIDYLRAGKADVLVTWESSRAQRDLDVYVKLREVCAKMGVLWCYKGRIHDLTRTDDRFTTGLDALLAEREADEIKDRVTRGQRHSAQQGRPPGRLLYGYQREYDPHTRALIRQVIRPDEAAIIREAAHRYVLGESIKSIYLDLNRRGITTGTGGPWSDSTVRRMITNPAYIGKRVYQGQVICDGMWPPILDAATFYACVRRVSEARLGRRDTGPRYLLTGIAACGVCGGFLRSIPQPRSPKRSYVCSGTSTTAGACVTILMERLDAYITELLLERLGRNAGELLVGDSQDEEVLAALAEADNLRARLEDFYTAAANGHLTASGLARIEAELLPQMEAAERRARQANLSPLLRDVIRPDIVAIWPTMLIAQQREIVRTLMTITLHPAKVKGRVAFDHSRVDVAWKHDI